MNCTQCSAATLGRGVLILLSGVVLLVAASCQGIGTVTPDSAPEVLVDPVPGSYLCSPLGQVSGVMLDEVAVRIVVCQEDLGDIEAGDACIEVTGRVTNNDRERSQIAVWGKGYDEAGNAVAWTQESNLIPGQIGLDVEYAETAEFMLHLNAPDEVETITIFAYSYVEFGPPSTPSSPVPESEMVHLIFSRAWILENDQRPSEGTVKVTFPESWLREPPTIAEGDDAVELTVPLRMLLDHNTSKNPDEVTVTFPDYYFTGLAEVE